jgi:hypothetical protein
VCILYGLTYTIINAVLEYASPRTLITVRPGAVVLSAVNIGNCELIEMGDGNFRYAYLLSIFCGIAT